MGDGKRMSMSVCLYSYKADELECAIAEYYQTKDIEKIDDILSAAGSFIGDRYLLLQNDFWEEYNAYFNLPSALDSAFGSEERHDVFGKCFCYPKDVEWEEICVGKTIEDLYEECGIEEKHFESA